MDWNNKMIGCLGDSITEGVCVPPGTRYFDELSRLLGAKAISYGQNGAQYHDLLGQAERMWEEQGDTTDLVIVFAGTNDFYGNIPLGEWFTEGAQTVVTARDDNGETVSVTKRRVRSFNFDMGTVKGRINSLLRILKHRYVTKEILLLTPLHRAYATFGPRNIGYDELYANDLGIFFEEYVRTIREAADIWSVRLVDLYRDSGLFPLEEENARAYYANVDTDRLHPNKAGHARIAKMIAAYLLAM